MTCKTLQREDKMPTVKIPTNTSVVDLFKRVIDFLQTTPRVDSIRMMESDLQKVGVTTLAAYPSLTRYYSTVHHWFEFSAQSNADLLTLLSNVCNALQKEMEANQPQEIDYMSITRDLASG